MKRSWLVAVVVALLPMAAWSAASAVAEVTRVDIRLVDLDPSDGIDPWLTISPDGASASAYIRAYSQEMLYLTPTANALAPVTWAGTVDGLSVVAALGGDGSLPALTARLSGFAPGDLGTGYGGIFDLQMQASTASFMEGGLMLSPATRAEFRLETRLYARTTIGCDGVPPSKMRCEYADASVNFDVLDPTNGFPGSFRANAGVAAGVDDSGNAYAGEVQSASATLTIDWVNQGTAALGGQFWIDLRAHGASTVLAVPEPGAGALSLIGLAGLAAIAPCRAARRRRPA